MQRVLFITNVNTGVRLRRVAEGRAGRLLVGSGVSGSRTQELLKKDLSRFSNANFWYSRLSVTERCQSGLSHTTLWPIRNCTPLFGGGGGFRNLERTGGGAPSLPPSPSPSLQATE